MKLIKTKQRVIEERGIISELTPIINDGYDGKEIQPELEDALPLFIHNIITTYKEIDLISSDLIGSPHLSDWTAEIGDMYDSDTTLATIIQAFSDLDTRGKTFDTVVSPKFFCRDMNNTTHNLIVGEFQVSMTFKDGKHPNELIEDFCVLNTKMLQEYFDQFNIIYIFNAYITKSYDEDMNPTIAITYRSAHHGKVEKEPSIYEGSGTISGNKEVTPGDSDVEVLEKPVSTHIIEEQIEEVLEPLHSIRIPELPVYVGGYMIGEYQLNLEVKPSWFKRTMAKTFFGLEWTNTNTI